METDPEFIHKLQDQAMEMQLQAYFIRMAGSVEVAMKHAYEARRLGHCPRSTSRPYYKCINGAIAFTRMVLRMADKRDDPWIPEIRERLLENLEELFDLQELG